MDAHAAHGRARYLLVDAVKRAHGGHNGGDEHSESEIAYDETAFARAVTEGIIPGGASLTRDMPRWRIGEADLQDLVAFLKTLD